MLSNVETFSSFAVDDLVTAKRFYTDALGLTAEQDGMLLTLHLAGGRRAVLYKTGDHTPADFTVLNFVVDDIDAVVDGLTERGVVFERYPEFEMDEKGIHREQNVAWFKDPAGNTLSVVLAR